MNKHIPKNKCPKCEKIVWDYNDSKDEINCTFCKAKGLKVIIKKILHGIVGAEISKDDKGMYVLAFPEYKEKSTYTNWKSLQEELDKLAENEKKETR